MHIKGRIPCIVKPNLFNQGYLEAKEGRMKHFLDGSWCHWNHDGGTVDEFDAKETDSEEEISADATMDDEGRGGVVRRRDARAGDSVGGGEGDRRVFLVACLAS